MGCESHSLMVTLPIEKREWNSPRKSGRIFRHDIFVYVTTTLAKGPYIYVIVWLGLFRLGALGKKVVIVWLLCQRFHALDLSLGSNSDAIVGQVLEAYDQI